ncbi:dentin sialophosphoprotein-like isoform X1 [Senna tora]|uniref:Dentin sialophosphoprotein-like isoform X1 n=1 Tax=Senna tora TaxID=362788 RepID=A0A834WNZ1_9FABA|nr:dentin sialophosphoprotein-like isoform X1 [Senna tora]
METFNQSINNEHVKISPETLDGSGTSEPADSNPKIFYHSESSTSSEGSIDITFGCEREDPEVLGSDNNNYPLIHSNGTNSILVPAETSSFGCESEDPDVSGSDNNNCPLTHINGTNSILVPAETSSSSSSSESSSNDLFQCRKVRFAESAEYKFASEDEQSDVSRESSIKSEASQDSPTSTSQIYNPTYGHMGMSPTVIPPVQMMDRSAGNDHQRIPSSAFGSKKDSVDWSYNSNDSLFSIQLGNASIHRDTSLTRDHPFLSHEELTNSGELNMVHPLPSDLIEDTDTGRKSVQMEDSQTTEMLDEDFKLEERPSKKNSQLADSDESPNVPGPSHGNGTSSHSSALTIAEEPNMQKRSVHGQIATVVLVAGSSVTLNCLAATLDAQFAALHVQAVVQLPIVAIGSSASLGLVVALLIVQRQKVLNSNLLIYRLKRLRLQLPNVAIGGNASLVQLPNVAIRGNASLGLAVPVVHMQKVLNSNLLMYHLKRLPVQLTIVAIGANAFLSLGLAVLVVHTQKVLIRNLMIKPLNRIPAQLLIVTIVLICISLLGNGLAEPEETVNDIPDSASRTPFVNFEYSEVSDFLFFPSTFTVYLP